MTNATIAKLHVAAIYETTVSNASSAAEASAAADRFDDLTDTLMKLAQRLRDVQFLSEAKDIGRDLLAEIHAARLDAGRQIAEWKEIEA